MPDTFRLQVKFWGVRGSTPTPHADFLQHGGNTSCIEVRGPAAERIIFDAGTGIRQLGRIIASEGPQTIHLFLSHFHWDHIQGLPFFAPLLTPGYTIHFHSFPGAAIIRQRLQGQMTDPYFTLNYNSVGASREYSGVESEFRLGSLRVTSFALNHPQGARGYRIESEGAAAVIATDFEHGNPELDTILRQYAEDADLLIYDSQYTNQEYAVRKGWGHSTYVEAAHVAADAHVRKLVLFHHDPNHTDQAMDEICRHARELFPATEAARESASIII